MPVVQSHFNDKKTCPLFNTCSYGNYFKYFIFIVLKNIGVIKTELLYVKCFFPYSIYRIAFRTFVFPFIMMSKRLCIYKPVKCVCKQRYLKMK